MYYSTKFSDSLQPYEISHFVFLALKKPIVEMGKNDDRSIYFDIEHNPNLVLTYTATDYFIECNSGNVQTKKLTELWQAFMKQKFGQEYVALYNKYSNKELEM